MSAHKRFLISLEKTFENQPFWWVLIPKQCIIFNFYFFYLALSSVHRLLVKLFADVEVDLGGAHTGGRFDVELLPVLADLHVGVGGRRHGHLPQHGVHPCQEQPQSGDTEVSL